MRGHHYIDFKNTLTIESMEILNLIARQADQRYFAAEPACHEVQGIQVSFSHPLYVRHREHDIRNVDAQEKEARFAILGEKLGDGHFGKVCRIRKEFAITKENEYIEIQNKPRVLKVMTTKFKDSFETLPESEKNRLINRTAREGRFAENLRHLRMKKVIFEQPDEHSRFIMSYLVMKEVSGHELLSIIAQLNEETLFLSFPQLINLAIRLAEAVKKQVHDLDIVHRDIKPENFIIDFSNPDDPIVNLIDFGLAKHVNEEDEGRVVGTPLTMAYEQWEKKGTTKKTDVYGLGVTFLELFTGTATTDDDEAYAQSIDFKVNLDDFEFIQSESLQNTLVDLLQDMTKQDKDARISIEECIERLYEIKLCLNEDKYAILKATNREREMVEIAMQINQAVFEGRSLKEIADLLSPIIEVDDIFSMNEFKFALGLRGLENCNSIKDVFLVLRDVMTSYSSSQKTLASLIDQYEKQAVKNSESSSCKILSILNHKQKKHGEVRRLDEMQPAGEKILKTVNSYSLALSTMFAEPRAEKLADDSPRLKDACVVM